jgi:hypothetical protein
MTDRDRLIDLIVNADTHDSYECKLCTKKDTSCTRCGAEKLTDYLLANGVIVPPIKVGQTVYVINGDEEDIWIDEFKVKYFYCSSKGVNRFYIECGTMGNNFRPKDIGKDVFLTKEDAEKELKRRGEENAEEKE